jgi:hypothetical protein
MATERIEELISKEALAQFDELNAKLSVSIAGFEKLVAEGVQINKTLGGNIGFKKFNDESKALTENQKALEQQSKALAATEAKLNATFTVTAEKLAQAKIVQGEVNKQMRDQAKEALGLVGAYDKLTKQYNEAAKEAKDLAAQYGAQSKQAQEASKRALELDGRLKAADANVGRFNKNVGNYSGALKILEKSLADVNKKIDDYTTSGKASEPVVEALRKEQGLLVQLLENQSAGFKSSTAEIKENTKGLQQMAAQGLAGTDAYRELFAATSELKDETSDLKKALTNAAPDDVAINAASEAARGLVGVYGVAKSTTAAFGIENEAFEETMVKLQAAETALQSIEAIRAVFKKENAVRQAISIGLQKVEILQTNLQTATESRSVVVRYAAIAAQKALNAAMALSGGPLLAIVGIIALLVISLSAMASSAGKARKSFKELNDELEINAKLTEDSLEAINNAGEKITAELESNFADEKTIRDKRLEFLQKQLDKQTSFNEKERINYEKADAFIRKSLKNKDDLSKKEHEELDAAIAFRDNYEKESERQYQLENKIDIERLNNKKANTEEYLKAQQDSLEVSKIGLESTGERLQSVISDEKRSYADRIAALQQFQKNQERIANLDAKSKKLDPSLTVAQIKTIEAERSAAVVASKRSADKQIADLNRESEQRERQARFEIAKIEISDQATASQRIADDETKSYSVRLDALYASLEKRRALLIAEHDQEVKAGNKTATELIALEKKYLSDINQLNVEYGIRQLELLQINQENATAATEKEQQRRRDILSTNESLELTAINERFREGKIGLTEYNRQIVEIEHKYRLLSLRQEGDVALGKVITTKEGTAERAAAEKELADATKGYSDEVLQHEIENQQKLKDKKKELLDNSIDLFETLVEANLDREKNAIQEQIDALDEKKQKEIEVATASITNEQDKAAAIAVINARSQAQKEALERRQRQLDYEKAKIERAFTIGRIIADTAAAVVAALGSKPYTPANIALAAVTGAIGAVQIAKVLSTPLPKYADGTVDHPGGLAIVGDGGRKEMIVTRDGKLTETPATATVMNIPRGAMVLPDSKRMFEAGIASRMSDGSLVLKEGSNRQQMTDVLAMKLDKLNNTIKNKREDHYSANHRGFTALVKMGNNWTNYIDDNINF